MADNTHEHSHHAHHEHIHGQHAAHVQAPAKYPSPEHST